MLQAFIKEWLLANRMKVYSIIADTYREELMSLKPQMFRAWLAKEIDIPEEKININSLHSALSRLRKKEKLSPKNNLFKPNNSNSFSHTDNSPNKIIKDNNGFQFSSPDAENKENQRAHEW